MHQRTVRTLRYAVLTAGVAVLGVGSAAAAHGVEPDTPNAPALDAAGNPAKVCNNDITAGTVLLEHPCVDGSQDPPVDVEEGSVPAP